MIFKASCLFSLSMAAATSVAAAVTFECEQVVTSATQNAVAKDSSIIYAATKYPSTEMSAGANQSKQLQKILYKRLLHYWMKESGYDSITVESSGMATQVVTCDAEQYAILYVPLVSVKVSERKAVPQEQSSTSEVSEPLKFERMQ